MCIDSRRMRLRRDTVLLVSVVLGVVVVVIVVVVVVVIDIRTSIYYLSSFIDTINSS